MGVIAPLNLRLRASIIRLLKMRPTIVYVQMRFTVDLRVLQVFFLYCFFDIRYPYLPFYLSL